MSAPNFLHPLVGEYLNNLKSFYGIEKIDFMQEITPEIKDSLKNNCPDIFEVVENMDPRIGISELVEKYKDRLENDDPFPDEKVKLESFISMGEKCVEQSLSPDFFDLKNPNSESPSESDTTNYKSSSNEVSTNVNVPKGPNYDLNILDELEDQDVRSLLHFGPFKDLMDKIGKTLPTLSTESACIVVSNHFLSFARENLHNLVMQSPGVFGQDKQAIQQRLELLGKFHKNIEEERANVFGKFSKEQLAKFDMYPRSIQNIIENEAKKNEIILKAPLDEVSVAEKLLGKLTNKFSNKNDPAVEHKLRIERESEVTKRLRELRDIAIQFKEHAGDPNWENTTGKILAGQASDLSKSTKKILDKVVGNVDEKGFGKKFSAIAQSLNDSSMAIKDAELKKTMEKLSKAMMEFIKKILAVIGIRATQTNSNANTNTNTPGQASRPKAAM